MLRDRGNIKWTSLMLPEHVEMLKNVWQEDHYETKPILDDQALELLNEQLNLAYIHQDTILLTVYDKGCQNDIEGKIIKINPYQRDLTIEVNHEKITIPFSKIITIKER
ncbi:YolD-like family protein [Oceanobacillus halotolerans]|uniref:YolD-like family protein n=1 Tax=Oceanobacillus halotolerans TaxID=2663380 RepID=UPI0013DAF04D|nr:YolD-like family protein [Oceanobacillus halotolerans]